MIWTWLACQPSTPTDTTGEDTSTETPIPTTALPLGEALAARCKDPTPPRVVPNGLWMHRATLSSADAVCNDGSPPVLYVRTASDPTHANDWVVHLMGGGACGTYEQCAARWCGEGSADAGDMSSVYAPETGGQTGILSPDPGNNSFAGWNVAQVYYCSSDLWVGTVDTSLASEVTGEAPYLISFRGADIVAEALAALDAGVTSDDDLIRLPSLTNAETILFSGSGAGAYGALVHLGRVSARYPSARVIGVADSVFSPSPDAIDPKQAAGLTVVIKDRYDDLLDAVYGAYVDEACVASGETAANCSDVGTLVRDHVAGELVVRHDLFDGTAADLAAAAGVRAEDLAEAGEGTLRGYGAAGFSVVGPTCGTHEVLDSAAFRGEKVADALTGPPALSLEEVLADVVYGSPRVVVDAAAGGGSVCP